MSGFKYKGTLLNDMIGPVSIVAQGNTGQYIKDANTTSTLSQYYNSLTNSSGPAGQVSNYIGRLYNNTLYTISPALQDIKNSVIAYHTDFNQIGQYQVTQYRPTWANACSVIIIGGGGGGAAGQQGFQNQTGQQKASQNGRGGGGGGAAGMVHSYGIQLTPTDQIKINVAAGGAAGVFAGNNNSNSGSLGGSSIIYFDQGTTTRLSITALGGGAGTTGSSNGQNPGLGGAGGWWTSTGPLPSQTQPYQGKNGQDGNPQQIFYYVNGGNVNLANNAGNVLPYQIISNGGIGQDQGTFISTYQTYTNSLGQYPDFAAVQGYGAGGAGGAAGTSNGAGPTGSQAGAGGNGFVRIYWLNTA